MSKNLVPILTNVHGASFISLDTMTDVSLKGGKKNPMQGRVTKLVLGSQVMVFQNKKANGYENMVRRRLEQEGKNPDGFELQPRKWGERIENLPLVRHEKDDGVHFYLEVIFLRGGDSIYFLDGKPIKKCDIIGLEDREDNPESQGGLDNKDAH